MNFALGLYLLVVVFSKVIALARLSSNCVLTRFYSILNLKNIINLAFPSSSPIHFQFADDAAAIKRPGKINF